MEESSEDIIRYVRPTTKETYAILLDKKNPFIGEIIEINESDNTVSVRNISDKNDSYTFLLEEGTLVLESKKDNYLIHDIERVQPFDLDILKKDTEQIKKQLTSDIIKELDISLEDIKEKDIIYTDTELKEELLSSLVKSFGAYDKLSMIQQINGEVTDIFALLKHTHTDELYTIERNKPLPKWLIPLVDNPIKLYKNDEETGEHETLDEIIMLDDIYNSTANDYYQIYRSILDTLIPVEPSLSDIGFNTNTYTRDYLRNCLQTETCVGHQGNYRFDKRSNKLSLMINDLIIHKPDTLNIVGLLYIPDSHLIQCLQLRTITSITLREKIILQNIINHNYQNILNLRIASILTRAIDEESMESIESNIDTITSYSFVKRLDHDEFYDNIKKLTPKPRQVLTNLKESVRKSLLNYDDVKRVFIKYNLEMSQLTKEDNEYILHLISKNYDEYLKGITVLPRTVIRIVQRDIPIQDKISRSKDLIMQMLSIMKRNEYLQSFMTLFSREPTSKEDAHSLYNIYSNEVLLCKHYLFSSVYHNDPVAHKSMLSVYGKPAQDGVIYCKHCGEYLCDEEFSAFDGFDDETPIQLRSEMKQDINLLESFKEENILLVKQLSTSFGVSITDEDIHLVMTVYTNLNQDIIANTRYNTQNITDTDEHPLVKDIKKKHAKEKNKKELIKRDRRKYQNYLKDTNKIITIVSLLIIVIQTAVPTYKSRFNYKFNFLEFTKSLSIDSLSYNKQVIDYCIVKLTRLCKTHDEPLWNHCMELFSEEKRYDLCSVKQQIVNLMSLIISPQYDTIQQRILRYGKYISCSSQSYIKDEWTTFKPLRNNKQVKQVDDLLKKKDELYKPYYILTYNNYPVENVSLINSLTASQTTNVHELVNIPVSEIMINKSFLLLFRIAVSNYGSKKSAVPSLYLHIRRFIDTIKHKEEIEDIFTKHGFNLSNPKTTSYKILRTKIIPEIINHYQKTKQNLEACYSDSDLCNRFIHNNMNNYDYFLLRGSPKRYYKYVPPVIFPYKEFDELSDELKNKVFKRYGKDPSDAVIKRILTDSYIGKFILNISGELDIDIPDSIREYESSLTVDEPNFKRILQTIQSKILSLSSYVKPKLYTSDDYTIDISSEYSTVESDMIRVFQLNDFYDISESHPVIRSLSNYIELCNSGRNIHRDAIKRELESSFSELTIYPFIESVSSFIYQIEDRSHKKRFASVFINTSESINITGEERRELEGDGFRYSNLREKDISKILLLFSNDRRLTTPLLSTYVSHIRYILSRLKNEPEYYSDYIPKNWKLSDTNRYSYKQYIQKNSLYIHQDMFKLNPVYKGYHNYTDKYIFTSLYDYIRPYINNLELLQTTHVSMIDETMILVVNKYILMFILHKLVEFHSKVREEDEEIISSLEVNIGDEELNIPTVASVVELFIIDLLTDILQMHYDSKWIISNTNKRDLVKRLSKQKEKEKQSLIHKLDTMTDEKRLATMELQRTGQSNWFKTSGEENVQRVVDEYTDAPDDEKYAVFNNLLKEDQLIEEVSNIYKGELDTSSEFQSLIPAIEEEGYMNIDDIDEDGQMGDEIHEFHDEDLLDNEFNE